MSKLGTHRKAWKVQRALNCELPGLGKPGALERRPYPPGQHGMARRKFSEYGLRLREKQKVLFHYGLREEQLRRLVKQAKSGKATDWMATLITLLESRVDNVVFRLGFAASTAAARQLVRHGKVLIDGRKLTVPSALVKPSSEIELTDEAYHGVAYQFSIGSPRLQLAEWLDHSPRGEYLKGRMKFAPAGDSIPFPLESRLVAEFYAGL